MLKYYYIASFKGKCHVPKISTNGSQPNQKEIRLTSWSLTIVVEKKMDQKLLIISSQSRIYSGGFVSFCRGCMVVLVDSFAFFLHHILTVPTLHRACYQANLHHPCISSALTFYQAQSIFADTFCFHLLLGEALSNSLTQWLSLLLPYTQCDHQVDILFFIMTYSTG